VRGPDRDITFAAAAMSDAHSEKAVEGFSEQVHAETGSLRLTPTPTKKAPKELEWTPEKLTEDAAEKAPEASEWTPEKPTRDDQEEPGAELKHLHPTITDLSLSASSDGREACPTVSGISGRVPLLATDQLPDGDGRIIEKPTRMLFWSMLCIFQCYAIMVGPCQQKFKKALHVGQFGQNAALFTQAADFVHWGKFFMRVGHNVVFGCFSPRQRVLIAMMLVLVGCAIPPVFVFTLGVDWIGTVFLSYGLAGMGIGISECTFLGVITPLGGHTKTWAILAVPVGFGVINIAGMVCTSVGVPVESLYFYVVAWVPIGMFIFNRYAPKDSEVKLSSHKQSTPKDSCAVWRSWLPMMTPCLVAKVVVNFAMENITPVSFYTFNAKKVPMFDPAATTSLMNHDIYFAILGAVTLIGNAASQHAAYKMNLGRYSSFVALMICACIGGLICCYLVTLKIATVSIAAVFLAFWANGTVYGGSAIFIDRFIPKQHNLMAYSVWCMLGDLGPILGGAGMDVLRSYICNGHEYVYTCKSSN